MSHHQWISGKDFRYLMTHFGDKLSEEEVDFLQRYMYVDPAPKNVSVVKLPLIKLNH